MTEIHEKDSELRALWRSYSAENADKIKSMPLDRKKLAARRLPYERLDQLLIDLLLGTR